MRTTAKAVLFALLAAILALTVIVVRRIEAPREYTDSILEKRRQKDLFMGQSPDSPFPAEQRSSFQGLSYFPPDPVFRVRARLVPIDGQEEIVVPTSDGSQRRYLRYAFAEFELGGHRHRLLLLQDRESRVSNQLFLAFRDQTSGTDTYGGGRYIDLFQQQEEEITIDFNLAYNPYCVYNYDYSCPLPPDENRLTVAIRAGEKMYPPQK
jgi:uncharacterized protein (DUF1684 family)